MTSVRPKKATNVKWNDSVVTIPEEVPPLDAVNRDAIQTTETPKNDDEQIFNGAAVAAGNDLGTSKWQERLVNLGAAHVFSFGMCLHEPPRGSTTSSRSQ